MRFTVRGSQVAQQLRILHGAFQRKAGPTQPQVHPLQAVQRFADRCRLKQRPHHFQNVPLRQLTRRPQIAVASGHIAAPGRRTGRSGGRKSDAQKTGTAGIRTIKNGKNCHAAGGLHLRSCGFQRAPRQQNLRGHKGFSSRTAGHGIIGCVTVIAFARIQREVRNQLVKFECLQLGAQLFRAGPAPSEALLVKGNGQLRLQRHQPQRTGNLLPMRLKFRGDAFGRANARAGDLGQMVINAVDAAVSADELSRRLGPNLGNPRNIV